MAETILVIPCFNESNRLDIEAIEAFLNSSQEVELLLWTMEAKTILTKY